MEKRNSSLIIAAGLLVSLGLVACAPKENPPHPEERVAEPAGSRETAATPAQPLPNDTRPVIVTFGDSLTAGVAGRSYPEDLQDLLDAKGYRYRVDNQGVSGDTTTDGLARIDNVVAAKPALVVLEFGGNDGLRGIPVEATRQNLSQMIERLQQARIPTVMLGITLPPNYGPDYVTPFTAMFPELAHRYRLSFLPFLLVHVYQHPELMQPDGIHPNGEGNKTVATDVFQLIQPELKSR